MERIEEFFIQLSPGQRAAARYALVLVAVPVLLAIGRFIRFNWSLFRTGMFRAYWFDS